MSDQWDVEDLQKRDTSRFYVECSGCGCDVLRCEASDIGINPATKKTLYLCEDCDEEEEEERLAE